MSTPTSTPTPKLDHFVSEHVETCNADAAPAVEVERLIASVKELKENSASAEIRYHSMRHDAIEHISMCSSGETTSPDAGMHGAKARC